MVNRVDIFIATCVAYYGIKRGKGAYCAVLVCDAKVLPVTVPVSYSTDFNSLFFALVYSLMLLRKDRLDVFVHVRNKAFCSALAKIEQEPLFDYREYNMLYLVKSLVANHNYFYVNWLETDDNEYFQMAKRSACAVAESQWKIFSYNPDYAPSQQQSPTAQEPMEC